MYQKHYVYAISPNVSNEIQYVMILHEIEKIDLCNYAI